MTKESFLLKKVVGVIYPVPFRLLDRIFTEGRVVFVKYTTHPTRVRIAPRNKVLFYASQGPKKIVGEAIIKSVGFLAPLRVLEQYGEKVFLNRNELMDYVSQQPSRTLSKKMLVLVLSKPKKYTRAISYGKPITMAGEYLTEEGYNTLIQETRQ